MKKLLILVLASLLILSAVGCGKQSANTPPVAGSDGSTGGTGTPQDVKKGEYVLKVGTVLTEADPLYKGLEKFKQNVEERTKGAVEVQLFASSQLGSDEDILEQAKVGAGVGVITDPGRLSSYIKEFGILGGPYLVDSYEESLKLLDTSVYKDFVEQFADDGLRILSFNYFQGTRQLFTKNPVSKPEDLKGQRIRSSGSDIVTLTVQNMGANPTVLAWSEAYPGLQQKVIDGVEVHYSAAVGSSIFEVTNYLSKTAHFQLLTGLVISNSWFEKLPAEYQQILTEESYNAGKYASEQVIAKNAEYEKTLLDKGLKMVDVDIDAFKKATEPVYDKLGYRKLKDKIDAELGK
ncbi:C4-dicarboxylate TRAP transporter substrate-binding protein [Petroclostridium xylanilyticum]|jgi:tripartite ATP-independent transporter DctP family solute receptor|uniref:C4-dicarboxylate TRAP transporter substrate-binding protein n=1 Tax=Petroclostridium xylanilyticum TaxID=1792311 RepID=UPI000B98EF83|nr:C4-dicarboxylate TRAP transporter substrate-binding protein [Petroclostridium xylanilyticum]